ncbi:MAG: ATP-binding cassette domain-containing protein [Candidatus Solibacter usitatus]|nr:ATP-binding cassette domain-containing protein [Candidatus Solibacter usitatus]
MPPLIEVANLVKEFRAFDRQEGLRGAIANLFHRKYRTVRAVDRIDFRIAAGEMVGYIGPNGAGKSTTVKMLTGILMPTGGEIRSNGFHPFEQRTTYTRTIGVVFGQRTQLWWDIAVAESFRLLKSIYGVTDSDYDARMKRFDEVLEIGRYLRTPVRKLSLGERMRCDVAAALLHNPPILFLDEPTIGLDIVAKERIREFLKEQNRQQGTTVLLTTHDLADIEELCARLMVIDKGVLLFDGPLAELKRRLWREMAVRFQLRDREQAEKLMAATLPGVTMQRSGDLTVRAKFDRERQTSADVIRGVLALAAVMDIAIEEESIEDVVKEIYTGTSLREPVA